MDTARGSPGRQTNEVDARTVELPNPAPAAGIAGRRHDEFTSGGDTQSERHRRGHRAHDNDDLNVQGRGRETRRENWTSDRVALSAHREGPRRPLPIDETASAR